jgi:hypothetical protein
MPFIKLPKIGAIPVVGNFVFNSLAIYATRASISSIRIADTFYIEIKLDFSFSFSKKDKILHV